MKCIRLIDEQGKLTEELRQSITVQSKLQEVEDLYRPYRQKRKTRASVAKERGLEPLAEWLLGQPARRSLDGGGSNNPEKGLRLPKMRCKVRWILLRRQSPMMPRFALGCVKYTYDHGIIANRGEGCRSRICI